jgi:hypothetical protein
MGRPEAGLRYRLWGSSERRRLQTKGVRLFWSDVIML